MPQWRHRFAPGVTHNTEHLFSLELARPAPVTLAPQEHIAFAWLPWREAARKCFSWSNRDAILMVGAALLAAGCATGTGELAPHLRSGAPEVRDCAAWYQALDGEIDAAGRAQRAGRARRRVSAPAGQSLSRRAARARRRERAHACARTAERLAELDQEARRHEIQNLPTLPNEARAHQRAAPRARLRPAAARCRSRQPRRCAPPCCAAAKVPDERRSCADRCFARRASDRERPCSARVRYAPPAGQRLPRGVVAGLLGRASLRSARAPGADRARGRPARARPMRRRFEIETRADYDRFGWLRWRRGMALPQVDAAEPTVYVHPAYTRYGDHVLLQLVYTLWFPERPPRAAFDPAAGPLDGVVWRVTLAPDGEPLVYDAIHACGCFHVFFPTARARRRPAPPDARRMPSCRSRCRAPARTSARW